MPQRTMLPWTSITGTFICISMFSFNINIRIHSVFDAKRLIGRNSDDPETQSDFKIFSNPRFAWNIEERKKNSYVVSFFRLFLVLTSFISSRQKKSLEWFQDEGNWGILTMLSSSSLLISTTLNGSPQRTPEPTREWTFPESIINESTAPTVSIRNWFSIDLGRRTFWCIIEERTFEVKATTWQPILVGKVSIAISSTTLPSNSNAKHGDFFFLGCVK